jgi:hypothetical protein
MRNDQYRNDRYREEREQERLTPIVPIVPVVAIVFCCLIIMEVIYFGGQVLLIKQTSNEIKEWASGIGSFITRTAETASREFSGSLLRPFPLYSAPKIVMPKSREQIVHEKSEKAYQSAVEAMAAFKKSYKKPEECYYMDTHKKRVDCANDFMRAKKEWDIAHGIASNN